MRFKVDTIRNKGRRLTRGEIESASPVVGDLAIRDLPAARNGVRRAIRYADLIDFANPSLARPLLRPLFDPVVVRVTPTAMLLMGHEIDAQDGVIHEHVQGWLLRSIEGA